MIKNRIYETQNLLSL